MKTLLPRLTAHLASGTTTLCQCWRLTLASGECMGFTDHDVALTFDGTRFEAQAGFTASEIQSALGLAVDNLEASGALSSAQLSDQRLSAGDFDHAQIEVWKVNWQSPDERVLLRKGHLGEVSFGQGAFTAEVRGLAHLLNQQRGRLYNFGCDASLGDARCGVAAAAFTRSVTITALHDGGLQTTLPPGSLDDWFTRGEAHFLSPANAGRKLDIKRQRLSTTGLVIEFWSRPRFAITPGEALNLVAGCNKQLGTCVSKFSNGINFRGFAHMPGNDFVVRIAAASDPNNNGLKRS